MRGEGFILIEPPYNSAVSELVFYLERFRVNNPLAFVGRAVHPKIFMQIRWILHIVECLASARIEGNRTTLDEYISEVLSKRKEELSLEDRLKEIHNIERAVLFIEDVFNANRNTKIDRSFISEVHRIIVDGLEKEGSKLPGKYRFSNVHIAGAEFNPPDYTQVLDYMEQWVDMVNKPIPRQYHLIRLALAHHRFVWIHPFDNGNGRVARALMYAMLLRDGFNVEIGKLMSPSVVFYNDRQLYYEMLARADSGREEDLLAWVEYVLSGIKHHAEKVVSLMDADFLRENIFYPLVDRMVKAGMLTRLEAIVLSVAARADLFQNSDVRRASKGKISQASISRAISSCVNKGYLTKKNGRKYLLSLENPEVTRLVVSIMRGKGLIRGDYD